MVIKLDCSKEEDVSIDTGGYTMVAGVTEDKTNDDSNREAIVTVEGSRSNFSKRDKICGDIVRRLQYAATFLLYKTLT